MLNGCDLMSSFSAETVLRMRSSDGLRNTVSLGSVSSPLPSERKALSKRRVSVESSPGHQDPVNGNVYAIQYFQRKVCARASHEC